MKFEYRLKNKDGQEIKGEIEANSRYEAVKMLGKEGNTLFYLREKRDKKINFNLSLFQKVPLKEKMFFARNLSVMIAAGLPLVKGLEILSRQTKIKSFKKILNELAEQLKKGKSFSESLKNYPKVFSPLFVAMVKVGEESGQLHKTLLITAQQMERDYTLRRKVKGAMVYPAIIIIAMILIGILMLIYVVPTLVSTFEELGVQLPLSTRIIIGISRALTDHTALFGLLFAVIFLLIPWILRTKKGKEALSFILIKLPLISPLVKKINSARTSRSLSSLISSGVDILDALEITKGVLQNHKYKEVLEKAKKNIQQGRTLSESFKKETKLYPIMLSEMIAVGEETGKLADMLLRLANFYEEEVAETTKNMSTIIEPILMVIIGGAVGFFAVSMIKPMYSMLGAI